MDAKKIIAIIALVIAVAAGIYLAAHRGPSQEDGAAAAKAEAEKIKSLGYAH